MIDWREAYIKKLLLKKYFVIFNHWHSLSNTLTIIKSLLHFFSLKHFQQIAQIGWCHKHNISHYHKNNDFPFMPAILHKDSVYLWKKEESFLIQKLNIQHSPSTDDSMGPWFCKFPSLVLQILLYWSILKNLQKIKGIWTSF